MKKIYPKLFLLLLSAMLIFAGCYYDNEEDLYVGSLICDTTNVTFNGDISLIFSTNCNSCHTGSAASGNIITNDYQSVKEQSQRIYGAVNHLAGFRPMPDNGSELPRCEILKLNAWINHGMPQ
ncbi:MAG TPA: cytochrome c [Lentimicrobium sp.]|nr:cytochrome c [Lentimicrobium sp.]